MDPFAELVAGTVVTGLLLVALTVFALRRWQRRRVSAPGFVRAPLDAVKWALVALGAYLFVMLAWERLRDSLTWLSAALH